MKLDIKRTYITKDGLKKSPVYIVEGDFRKRIGQLVEPGFTFFEPFYLSVYAWKFKQQVKKSLAQLKKDYPDRFPTGLTRKLWLNLNKKLPFIFFPEEYKGWLKSYHQVWRERNPVRWNQTQTRWYYQNREKVIKEIRSNNIETKRGRYKFPNPGKNFNNPKFWRELLKVNLEPIKEISFSEHTALYPFKRRKNPDDKGFT